MPQTEYQKTYYLAHRDTQKYKEKMRQYAKNYYNKNKVKVIERVSKDYQTNRLVKSEKMKFHARNKQEFLKLCNIDLS